MDLAGSKSIHDEVIDSYKWFAFLANEICPELGTILVRQYESVIILNRECLMRRKRKLCMVDNGRHKFRRYNNNNNNVSKTYHFVLVKTRITQSNFHPGLYYWLLPCILSDNRDSDNRPFATSHSRNKRHAEEHRKHRTRPSKELVSFKIVISFVCLFSLRLFFSSMTVFGVSREWPAVLGLFISAQGRFCSSAKW